MESVASTKNNFKQTQESYQFLCMDVKSTLKITSIKFHGKLTYFLLYSFHNIKRDFAIISKTARFYSILLTKLEITLDFTLFRP